MQSSVTWPSPLSTLRIWSVQTIPVIQFSSSIWVYVRCSLNIIIVVNSYRILYCSFGEINIFHSSMCNQLWNYVFFLSCIWHKMIKYCLFWHTHLKHSYFQCPGLRSTLSMMAFILTGNFFFLWHLFQMITQFESKFYFLFPY